MNQPTAGSNYNHNKQSHNHNAHHQGIQYNNSIVANATPTKKPINSLLLSPLQSRVLEAINDYMQYSGHMFDLPKCVEV
jgi:hypothetical protein